MDEVVARAIVKWPNVAAAFGWLALDRRGRWHLKGELISNPAVTAFISRNYGQDAQGRWFFQNGPQRVFVTLAYTPFVYRLTAAQMRLRAHTGVPAQRLQEAWLDETGSVLLGTELGIGLLHDQDLQELVSCISAPQDARLSDDDLLAALDAKGAWAGKLELRLRGARLPLRHIESGAVPRQFGFEPDPRPAPGQPEC